MQRFRYVYGPVLSRRLGRSLGVDVIPYKTCSYDCVYCLLGRTTRHCAEPAEYVPARAVLEELAEKLRLDSPDAVSFAGSGEPTLNSRLGDIIRGVKKLTAAPVVVFTNSSLLWRPEVREGLAGCDIISPSLDAALPATAQSVNRLAPGLDHERIYRGLQRFCRDFTGRIWLEVLLAAGFNDADEDIEALARAIEGLDNIECVQLNTVVRPPAEKCAAALSRARLEEIRGRLPGRVEIIAPVLGDETRAHGRRRVTEDEIRDLLERHPSTLAGLAEGLDADLTEVQRLVERLCRQGGLCAEDRDGSRFYCLKNPS